MNVTETTSGSGVEEEGGWSAETIGIVFVLIFDFIVFIIGFGLFIVIRHLSLSYGETLLDTSKQKPSHWRRFVNRTFNRYSEHKREEDESWFGWIPATIKANDLLILEECGRDGYLYLRYQKLLVLILFIESLLICPLLITTNIVSDYQHDNNNNNTHNGINFSTISSSNVPPQSSMWWAHTSAVLFITILLCLAIYITIRSITRRTDKEIASQARLFTAKISNIPKYINHDDDPQLLHYFNEIYPTAIQQVYICKRMEDLRSLEKQLQRTESKIYHFECQMAVSDSKEVLIYSSRWLREMSCVLKYCLPCIPVKKSLNALTYYQEKAEKLRERIEGRKKIAFASTGVAFITFRKVEFCSKFISDFTLPNHPPLTSSPSINKYLKISQWLVHRAPQSDDVEWENLHISSLSHFIRIVIVNIILFIALFFFTTPVAMISGVKDISSHFPFISTLISSFLSTTFGNLFLTFLPSFLLLLLTFLLPHILFFTTKFEGYHTRNDRNSAGIYKVYLYQIIALLILPSFAFTSIESLISSLSFSELIKNMKNGGLFPNGVLFIKYVLQAALLANTCDIWRGPEIILEFIYKSRATTSKELKEAEEVPPFVFGFEYQYFMVVFTITLFYSAVIPIIIPCGFLYLLLKHFVDKSVITITLIGLAIYQIMMGMYFWIYKEVMIEGLTTLACAGVTIGLCLFTSFYYFPRWNAIVDFDGIEKVDAKIFRDNYLHPCLKDQQVISKKAQRQYNTFEDYSLSNSSYLTIGDPLDDPSFSSSPSRKFTQKIKQKDKSSPLSLLDYSSYDEKYDASD